MNSLLFALLTTSLLAGLSAVAHANDSNIEVISEAYAKPGKLIALGGGRA